MLDASQFRTALFSMKVSGETDAPAHTFSAKKIKISTSIKKNIVQQASEISPIPETFWRADKNEFSLAFTSGQHTKYKNVGVYATSSGSAPSQSFAGDGFYYANLKDPNFYPVELAGGDTSESTFYNSGWGDLDSSEKSFLLGSGNVFTPTMLRISDPAKRIRFNGAAGAKNYRFLVGDGSGDLYTGYERVNSRAVLNIVNSVDEDYEWSHLEADNDAWISYNIQFGTNYKSLFAYAIEFCDFVDFSGYFSDGTDPYSRYVFSPKIGLDPYASGGAWNYSENYQRLCSVKGGCDPTNEDYQVPDIICWTGRDITGSAYNNWISGIFDSWKSDKLQSDYLTESSDSFSMSGVELLFTSWTGYILFGDLVSGDAFHFSPYNFRDAAGNKKTYEEVYTSTYLKAPPYGAPKSFTLEYMRHFNSPSTLVAALNSGFTQPVEAGYNPIWYPYPCPTGYGETGFFIETNAFPLATGEICDSCITGIFGSGFDQSYIDKISGRLISIKSNHFNSGGYSLTFSPSAMRSEVEEKTKKDRLKYLLPTGIVVEKHIYGEPESTWYSVDSRSDIRWDAVIPQKRASVEVLSEEISGVQYIPYEAFSEENIGSTISRISSPSGTFETLFELEKTTYKYPSQAYCPPVSNTRQASVVWPVGWPESDYVSGKHPCLATGIDGDCPDGCITCGCTDPLATNYDPQADCSCVTNGEPNGCCEYPLSSKDKLNIKNFSFYKTGWLTEEYYSYLDTDNEAGLISSFVGVDKIKITLKGLKHLPKDAERSIPVNSFYVKNINLFSIVDGSQIPLTGDPVCAIGSDYTVDVFGRVPVNITGFFTGEILPEHSGVRDFKNALITGKMSGLNSGDWVRFHNASGKLTQDHGSGYFSGKFYGTGVFENNAPGWFYEPTTEEVTFKKPVTLGIFNDTGTMDPNYLALFDSIGTSGSGQFSGKFISINEDVVNRELVAGGFLNPEVSINYNTGVYFRGNITGNIAVTNKSGFFDSGYRITGYSDSGSFFYETGITGVTPQIIYVLENPTGFVNASVNVAVTNLATYDYLSINGEETRKAPAYDLSTYSSPEYFYDFAQLVSGISGSPLIFGAYIKNVDFLNQTFTLEAAQSGVSGNLIPISTNSTGFNISSNGGYLTGGQTFYQRISGTGNYDHDASGYIAVTGYYTSTGGSGYLSGNVPTYMGLREFSGVWDISSGAGYSFKTLELFSAGGDLFYSGDFGGASGEFFPVSCSVKINYNDVGLPVTELDVVKLKIFDINSASGVEYFITGTNNL